MPDVANRSVLVAYSLMQSNHLFYPTEVNDYLVYVMTYPGSLEGVDEPHQKAQMSYDGDAFEREMPIILYAHVEHPSKSWCLRPSRLS